MADFPITQNDGRSGPYVATAGQTVFTFDFPLFATSDLVVTRERDGVETTLTLTTDYTITGGVNAQGGGTITLTSGALLSDILTLERKVPESRSTDFAQRGEFRADVVNQELDRIVMMAQQLRRDVDRAARLAKSVSNNVSAQLPFPEAGKAIGWSANGLGLANYVFADAAQMAAAQAAAEQAIAAAEAAQAVLDNSAVTPTGGDTARALADILSDVIDARSFGVVGDDATDCAIPLANFLDFLKINGGWGRLPPGRIRSSAALAISDGAVPFRISGYGMFGTTLVRTGAVGTLLSVNRTDGWTIEDFGIDSAFDTIPTNAGQCFTSLDCENPTVRGIFFDNYLKSAVLMYSSSPDDGLRNSGGVIEDCYFDGRNVGCNGFLIADMDDTGIRRCGGKGVFNGTDGPGYAHQLKNRCRRGFIHDVWAESVTVVVAFGNDNNLLGVTEANVSGVRGLDFVAGFIGSYCEDNVCVGFMLDATGTADARGILLDDHANRNVFGQVAVKNITGTGSAAVLIRNTSTDNFVELALVSNPEFARFVNFGTGAARNYVRILAMVGGAAPATPGAATANTSAVDTNLVEYRGMMAFMRPTVSPNTTFAPVGVQGNVNAGFHILAESGECRLALGNPSSNQDGIFGFSIASRFAYVGVLGGLQVVRFLGVASAVNRVNIQNAATGTGPLVQAAGSDTNVPLRLDAQGAAPIAALDPMQLPTVTVANIATTYPPASYPRCLVYVSNGASNKRLAVCDGTTWRYPDGAAV